MINEINGTLGPEFAKLWGFDFEIMCCLFISFIFLLWKMVLNVKTFISEIKLGTKARRCRFHKIQEINVKLSLIFETLPFLYIDFL